MPTAHSESGLSNAARRVPINGRLGEPVGASLLELIVVLFIIGVMCGLLFPALQAARSKADSVACQNNVRQVGMALSQAIDVMDRFPQPNRWTIDILKWIEERPMADHIATYGIPPNGQLARPKLLQCIAQPDFSSTVPDVGFCHYVLVVDRPVRADRRGNVRWDLHDRPRLSDDEPQSPWYVGPEISFVEQQSMLATTPGPHPSGVYYTWSGQTRGGTE
jgi:type II secretory pathway pseudopilin PulG